MDALPTIFGSRDPARPPIRIYPTVLLDPPADADVSTHEVFGPVVCVRRCRS